LDANNALLAYSSKSRIDTDTIHWRLKSIPSPSRLMVESELSRNSLKCDTGVGLESIPCDPSHET